MKQALILAGGLGTRFREIDEHIPKGLALIHGRPVLEHQILALRRHGIDRVVLCVGHLSEMIEQHFGDATQLGLQIMFAREKQLLGTAGAMLNARGLLDDQPFLALNGDTLMPPLDYTDLMDSHRRHYEQESATIATMVVTAPPDAGAYGVIDLDAPGARPGRIVRYREKAPVDPATALISGGIYILEQRIFDFIEPDQPTSIEMVTFPKVLQSGGVLWAYRYDGFFGDIGTLAGYQRVKQYIEKT